MCPRSHRLTIASTRLRVSQGGRGARPEKNMLYSASSLLSSASSVCRSRWISDCSGISVPSFPFQLQFPGPELRLETGSWKPEADIII